MWKGDRGGQIDPANLAARCGNAQRQEPSHPRGLDTARHHRPSPRRIGDKRLLNGGRLDDRRVNHRTGNHLIDQLL